ncbi:MAG: glycosyltransferase family 4 protein [Pseudomonadota bacterium]
MFFSLQISGGAIESLFQLASHLDKSRFNVTVVFLADLPERQHRRFTDMGCEVIVSERAAKSAHDVKRAPPSSGHSARLRRLPFWGNLSSLYHWLRGLGETAKDREESKYYASLLRELGADIVHINNAPDRAQAIIYGAETADVPCVSHVRGMPRLRTRDRKAARKLSALICISEAVKHHIVGQGVIPDKTTVIHNGVDKGPFKRPIRGSIHEELKLEKTTPLVGMIGRLDYWKGHDVFLPAFRQVMGRIPDAKAIVVGGEQGSLRNRHYASDLRGRVSELGLDDSVTFLGHRDDIPDLMRQLRVLVLASTKPEPFGRVLIESMVAGTPVVATDAGGVPEIVSDGRTGLLVPPGNADAMADAISRILLNKAEAKAIVTRAQCDAEKRFTATQTAQRVTVLYDRLLSAN